MTTLSIDLETFSGTSLEKAGFQKYTEDEFFTILLFGYRINKGPVTVIDLAQGETLPDEVLDMLTDPNVIKKAFNAQFERACLEKYYFRPMPPNQWRCTMVKCAMLGLPMNLFDASRVLGVADEKEMIGKKYIRYFCVPCAPTKTNGMRVRNLPQHDIEGWNAFKGYCKTDVLAEDQVDEKTDFYIIPEREQAFWELDQQINDYGIEVDTTLIQQAVSLDVRVRKELIDEATRITGLDNPNSVDQLKKWIELEIDESIKDLRKDSVAAMIKDCNEGVVKRILQIRQLTSKSSLKKYVTAANMCGIGNRVRSSLQFYGASRTGRHAGRKLQPHNFPINYMKNLDLARELVRNGDHDLLLHLWDDVPNVLKQLLRTMFIAGPGRNFIMADFAQIEARVIAWYAGEKWRLDLFEAGGKLYETSASKIFKVPLSECGKGSKWRPMGKVYELACGFQGAVGAVRRMDNQGILSSITDETLAKDIRTWRNESPNIRQMWYDVQNAAIQAVQTGNPTRVTIGPDSGLKGAGAIYKYILFFVKHGTLFCKLPSGRCLSYLRPELRSDDKGYPALWYLGIDSQTHQWKMISTYGGKLVENIVQATARDLLREKMFAVRDAGFTIVFHVHDEIIVEVEVFREPHLSMNIKHIEEIMAAPVIWAPGLPLSADAYASPFYYKKD
jgi:DNA polymerase